MSDAPDVRLLCGDAIDQMAKLEAGSVNVVVTSPPYWGLRKYSGEQERVWGGIEGCEHEWVDAIWKTGPKKWDTSTGKTYPTQTTDLVFSQGDSCLHCGAWRGAYGLEPTPEMWVEHTMEWLRAVRRVLRDDGVVWLNVGSSYWGGGGGNYGAESKSVKGREGVHLTNVKNRDTLPGYKPLDLVWAAALLYPALLREGWWVRSVVIWAKPNPMPESVSGWRWEQHRVKVGRKPADWNALPKGWDSGEGSHDTIGKGNYRQEGEREATVSVWTDCPGCPTCEPNDGLILRKGSWRPTSSYEEILMLAKGPDYFADGEDVREAQAQESIERRQRARLTPYAPPGQTENTGLDRPVADGAGRNLRGVWTFPTQPFKDAHFATFPEELVHRCILSSTPEKVCAACGEPWARVVNYKANYGRREEAHAPHSEPSKVDSSEWQQPHRETLDLRATCRCKADTRPAVVLDPFGGSGTVSVVARKLGRHSIYINLSEDYREMARKRLEATMPRLC